MKKALVIGIIFLFVGVAFQPAVAVNLISFDNDNDCSICPSVSKSQVVRLRGLLNILNQYDNKLAVLSILNPKIAEKYQEVTERISILQGLIASDNCCDFLGIILVIFLLILNISLCKELIIFDIVLHIIFGILFIISFALWFMFCYEEPEYYFI